MNRKYFICTLILAGLCLAVSQAAVAHHSTTYYALEPKTIQGTVVEFRWRNPHAVVVWDAKDESGKTVRWAGELSSVTTLMGDGLTKDSLKQGDEIIFSVRPSKAGTAAAVIQSMKRPNGTWVLRWSTQSETGLSKEQVEKLRVDAGLPKEGPGRSAPQRQ
jgi:Family of unknown function (DUF6152)